MKYMTQWQKTFTRERPKTKAELREMLGLGQDRRSSSLERRVARRRRAEFSRQIWRAPMKT
jgi:hypothetical protein